MASAEADADAIERRIHGTLVVQRILQALFALTRGQQAAVLRAAHNAAAYGAWVDDVAREVIDDLEVSHAHRLHVCFGPERAFSGPLARHSLAQVPSDGELALVGTRLIEQARGSAIEPRIRFTLCGCTTPEDAKSVAESIASALLIHGRDREVHLHAPVSNAAPEVASRLLAAASRKSLTVDCYTPSETLIATAVRERLESQLISFALSSLSIEVLARLVAVERAKKAADSRLDELGEALRVERQEGITRELIEILAGSELATS